MSKLSRYEFHRGGIGRLADPKDHGGGTAIFVERVPGSTRPLRSCTCPESRDKACAHLGQLDRGVETFRKRYGTRSWEEVSSTSAWMRLARMLFDGSPQPFTEVVVQPVELTSGDGRPLRVTSPEGEELALYLDESEARTRFLERLGKAPGGAPFDDRVGMLERLALFQSSPQERQLTRAGMKSQRQSWEESFWYRLAYHCVREHGLDRGRFHPAIDEEDGRFTLTFETPDEEAVARFTVPRKRVHAVIKLLRTEFPEYQGIELHPIPLQSLFLVTQQTELDLEVRPVIRALQQTGLERFLQRDGLERFRYGNLIYIKMLGVLTEVEPPDSKRKFRSPAAMRLRRSQVPGFREQYVFPEEGSAATDPLKGLQVLRDYDYVEITAETLERSWYWLSVDYGFGSQSISLRHILRAQQQGLPYLETEHGWIDLGSPMLRKLETLVGRQAPAEDPHSDRLRFSATQLLRLQAVADRPVRIVGESDHTQVMRRLLELRPPTSYVAPDGLTSTLRHYQTIGVDWLRFLWENRLGGLLCDDMGLGKTHQSMALMLCLREQADEKEPFLVVCPTSVISHWRNKIRDHAPGLRARVYHGPERSLDESLAGDVLITSYGILRNDIDELRRVPFALAIFDEIQHLKNRDTLSYQSAAELHATVKLGLTGTPIENTLIELKALLDLVVPGYLGSDADFDRRYSLDAEDTEADDPRLRDLRRVISPFVLRRLKATVLDELPEKFDDVRTCTLSADQVKLYRDAISTRAGELVNRLRAEEEPLPYIHIFALLNYMKQVCDHPALALHDLEQAAAYQSGKWDLYREILQECLDSGHKVVVFTQYLGMITLMSEHLKQLGIDFVRLTGASIHRGEIVERFNEDPTCRVFLGSLKAGGTGIDLVGGSVVIHYDRWWNAAREDQATDRVHRIGQKRAVQVFKLVTEGTLEEKIAAIIDRKRKLMESVVQEDDPSLAKIFSREELLDLLEPV